MPFLVIFIFVIFVIFELISFAESDGFVEGGGADDQIGHQHRLESLHFRIGIFEEDDVIAARKLISVDV